VTLDTINENQQSTVDLAGSPKEIGSSENRQ